MADPTAEQAMTPDDLPRLFVQFAKAGEFERLATLYEPDAVIALPPGETTRGNKAIAKALAEVLAGESFDSADSQPQPTLNCGEFALTSTHLGGGRVTAEVAHRQADGSWRWVIDQPDV